MEILIHQVGVFNESSVVDVSEGELVPKDNLYPIVIDEADGCWIVKCELNLQLVFGEAGDCPVEQLGGQLNCLLALLVWIYLY